MVCWKQSVSWQVARPAMGKAEIDAELPFMT